MNTDRTEEKVPQKTRKLYYKQFEYVDEMVNWFNDNPDNELITFSVGKGSNCFLAVYRKYE